MFDYDMWMKAFDLAGIDPDYYAARTRSLDEARELISRNSQNISSLVAQAQIANQRIAELSVKTDRLFMKVRGEE